MSGLEREHVTNLPEHIAPTSLEGVYVISRPRITDDRGSFQENWRLSDVELITGKEIVFRQSNLSLTIPQEDQPVLRGLHAESQYKLITPMSGRIWAVFADLREGSRTFLRHGIIKFNYTSFIAPRKTILLPPGVANSIYAYKEEGDIGDGSVLYSYTVSKEYDPGTAGIGVRFDDPTLAIPWPNMNPQISNRDKDLPTLDEFLQQYSQLYK